MVENYRYSNPEPFKNTSDTLPPTKKSIKAKCALEINQLDLYPLIEKYVKST